MEKRCCHELFRDWRRVQCHNKANVEWDGKLYCGVHDPVKVAARRAKTQARWDAERKAENDKYKRLRLASEAYALLEATCPDDPLGNLERLIAADKEAHRQWRAEQKKEIDAFFDEADKEAGE